MCVWPVYIYHRATWDMSVQSIVLPHPTVLVEFCDSHSFPWVTHMHGKTVLQVVFWAACCTACGPEGSAVLHQHVLWVRRAWISFCLQPLIQSHWKGSVWGLLTLGTGRWMCCWCDISGWVQVNKRSKVRFSYLQLWVRSRAFPLNSAVK